MAAPVLHQAPLPVSDPAITADHLVVLADDRGLQPAENVVPLVRRDVVAHARVPAGRKLASRNVIPKVTRESPICAAGQDMMRLP